FVFCLAGIWTWNCSKFYIQILSFPYYTGNWKASALSYKEIPISTMYKMDNMEKQGDLADVKEGQESTLSSKMMKRPPPENLSADKSSLEHAQKRRAVNNEVECNDIHDKGDKLSRKLVCRTNVSEDEAESKNESNDPLVCKCAITVYK
ncbi:Valine--tRNA ligase, partial [Bienertia sinuspersici]